MKKASHVGFSSTTYYHKTTRMYPQNIPFITELTVKKPAKMSKLNDKINSHFYALCRKARERS